MTFARATPIVPQNPATWRGLLCTEHGLDAGPNSALSTVRVLLRLRQSMVAVRALMNAVFPIQVADEVIADGMQRLPPWYFRS